jgi:oligosaccharide repeat unit polymerase
MELLIFSWFVYLAFFTWLLYLNKTLSFYNPLVMLYIIIFIFGVGKIIYLCYFASDYLIHFNLMSNDFSKLYDATLISYLFILSVFAGFAYTIRFKYKKITERVISYKGDSKLGLFISLFILIISLVSLYLFLVSGGGLIVFSAKRFLADGADPSARLNDINYLLFKLTQLSELPFYVSYFYYLLGDSKYKRTWFIIAMLSLIIIVLNSIVFSNRAALIILFIDMFLIYIIIKGKLNTKVVFSTALVFFVVFMFMSILRSGGTGDDKTIMDHLFGGRYFADIAKLSVIIESLNSSIAPSPNFDSILSFISSYMNIGRFVGEHMFGTNNSGVPMGIVAELYWINGLAFVVTGGLIIGFIYKIIFMSLVKKKINMFIVLAIVFIYSRSVVFLLNNGLGVTIYQIALDMISLILFVILTFKTKQKVKVINFKYSPN